MINYLIFDNYKARKSGKNYFGYVRPFIKDANGDLYFSGVEGIDRVCPDKFKSSPPSSVYLQSLEVNQKPVSLSTGVNNLEELSLKHFQKNISIATGIIDYYSKGSSRIRYKLEGLNDNWQYAPNYYTIRYDGLHPGKYTLILQASNATNEFNGPEKILTINVSPPFWQTNWFRILMGIVLVTMLYGIYRWRTATLHRQKRILEQTVKERTAEVVEEKAVVERQKDTIQKEKEKSDELLLNILPSEVADELKEKGYTTAKSFDEVTVLFSDIKGFTNVAEKMTAQELVNEINTYFSAFDGIIQQYGLEKIKTIGDAYIAAGGLPEKNSATAQ
ncbi:MAG: adenylate/guanylate cyclase domain-containing protein, partial [Chitinophagaceae bacterium]